MGNNKSYAEKVCYNISMIDLTDNSSIEEFKAEITKAVINLYKIILSIILKNSVIAKNLIEQSDYLPI